MFFISSLISVYTLANLQADERYQSRISELETKQSGLISSTADTNKEQVSAKEVVAIMNTERAKAGLSPLAENPRLNDSAKLKNQDMIERKYWEHNAPDGTQPWVFFAKVGYQYKKAGENLACNFRLSSAVVQGWMDSPTHRANVLDPEFADVGVAYDTQVPGVKNRSGEGCLNLITAHYGTPIK